MERGETFRMRKAAFTTIRTVQSFSEAESELRLLRRAGLHPVDLSLSAPLPLNGSREPFPIQVPSNEADAARGLLKASRSVS
jgi:hypothetical protein